MLHGSLLQSNSITEDMSELCTLQAVWARCQCLLLPPVFFVTCIPPDNRQIRYR